MSDNEIAVIEKPRELSVVEVKSQVAKVHTLMQELMQEGTHYGESFPGDTKKNLLKPGADKLCFMFRLRPDFTQEKKELPNGHMEVLTRCQIFHIESGQKIADGVGLATTMESKYRWRNGARKCPVCGKETIKKSRFESGGFYCYEKIGGCGAKFKEDDPSIVNQVVGKIENPDIADTYNTVIKMSKKRAYVDATITACAASDIFSQDAEDFKDTPESLARQAEQEEPRNVTEPLPQSPNQPSEKEEKKTAPVDKPKTERQNVIDNIGAILLTKTPDSTDFFTAEEKNNVRADIAGTKNIEALKKIAADWQKELEKRRAEYQPIPFDENNAPEPAAPVSEAQPPADDHFDDDIPWDEKGKPGKGKPASLKEAYKEAVRENAMANASQTETADTGASEQLDIF